MSKVNLNRIKSVLAEKNKSNKDLVSHLSKTESTVSRWCTNEVQPSVETLFEIVRFLEVDVRELLVGGRWICVIICWRFYR
jgi:transcriptional regulator with XRE-family HTH domain